MAAPTRSGFSAEWPELSGARARPATLRSTHRRSTRRYTYRYVPRYAYRYVHCAARAQIAARSPTTNRLHAARCAAGVQPMEAPRSAAGRVDTQKSDSRSRLRMTSRCRLQHADSLDHRGVCRPPGGGQDRTLVRSCGRSTPHNLHAPDHSSGGRFAAELRFITASQPRSMAGIHPRTAANGGASKRFTRKHVYRFSKSRCESTSCSLTSHRDGKAALGINSHSFPNTLSLNTVFRDLCARAERERGIRDRWAVPTIRYNRPPRF